ncbi:coiled-coil domain-containing protein 138-like isoform X2 [Vombatus ursinus]|uniref:Coiled-coil domain containing 138 n=1 Tax=Vombatus ursinus TaxID=29139 RepID=A0A4X2KGQ3_VOMUR|nr:coiled-coil domain-containing protein 138-like isoform X2 [Vombatus ursinus]XP_027722380.1 coiled-coil domain-containing protein 138-like isoform X2 [Vombatus ursinus]
MDPKIVKPPGQDEVLERLKNRYGICSNVQCEFVGLDNQVRCKSRRSLTYTDVLDNLSSDPVMPLPTDSAATFSHNTEINSSKPLCDLFKKNVNCLDDDLDYFCDLSPLEVEEELVEGDHSISIAQGVKPFTKETPPDMTLLCNSVSSSEYFYDGYCSPLKYTDKSVSSRKMSNKLEQSLLPPHINQIYNELSLIHQKLQQETAGQQEFAAQLHKREHFLSQKEELLIQHEAALTKIKSVEEEIRTKFQIMKEHHIEEIKHLTEALKEKTKENKRLKSSFDTLKELNDNLKKQLNDVSEQNKKMEVQAKRVQGRLENLQRKCDFVAVQKCKAISPSLHEMKTTKQEKTSTARINKVNGRVYEILIVLMEWISDYHLSKLKPEDDEGDDQKQSGQFSTHKNYIQEKCVKLLPVIAEQLQWMPFVNLKLHLPVIKFIYWSIRQLDYGTQHSTMTATMRRLGEELFKGVTTGTHDSSPEHFVATKPKTAVFFKSPNLSLRFLSTLIVLKTVTQVDYLAHTFDSLCLDLKIDEGKALFLEYQAVPVILSHLKITNKGLLSNVMDSLLQMTVESRFLQPFLEACSNVLFFRTCSVLLRHPKLDLQILEKLSIILQKLSKIKSNKKLFELFTLHLMLQEIQRTANPEHVFLCINLNSTLFNLGLTKCNSLVTTANS